MLDLTSLQNRVPTPSRTPEAPQVTHAFLRHHRPFLVLAGVLIIQLLLVSFQVTGNHGVPLIRVWAMTATGPFDRALRGISDAARRIGRTGEEMWLAQQENRALRDELARAKYRIQNLSDDAVQAQRLRALLELRAELRFQTTAAEVIGSSPGASSNALVISKGSDAGLTTDLAVLTPDGVVGKIIAVFPHTAQVLLVSDPTSGAGCMLQGSRVQGVLKGAGNGLCRMDYVMNDEKVSPGDAVITSGLDQIYPKGLQLGTVVRVSEGNIYRNILVCPAAHLDRLENVLVALKPATTEQQALGLSGR